MKGSNSHLALHHLSIVLNGQTERVTLECVRVKMLNLPSQAGHFCPLRRTSRYFAALCFLCIDFLTNSWAGLGIV